MSNIDWGALQNPQIPARVVAQVAPNQNTVGNALGGLAQGIQQGIAIRGQLQQTANAKQQADQSAQLFPSELSNAQSTAHINQNQSQLSDMNLAATKQSAQDAQTMKETYAKGTQAWLQAGVKTYGPMFAVNYQKAKADADKVVADIAETRATTASKLTDTLNQYQDALGNIGVMADHVYTQAYQQVASGAQSPNTQGLGLLQSAGAQAAQSGQTHQLADKIATQQASNAFDIGFSYLKPEDQKLLASKGLDKYSMATTGAFKTIGSEAHIRMQAQQDAEAMKNLPPEAKAQAWADQQNKALAQNPNDPTLQEHAANANKALQTSTTGPKMVETPLDKINAGTSEDAMKSAHEQSQKNIPIIANLQIYKQQMQGFTPGRFADTDLKLKSTLQGAAALFGLKPTDTNAGVGEQLESINNQLKLQFASEIKNARMNASMFSALSKIPPSIDDTRQGAMMKVDRLLYLKQVQNGFTDFQDKYIQQNGSVMGIDKQWNNFLQAAPLMNKDGSMNTQHLQDDVTPYLNPKYVPPKNAPGQGFSDNQINTPQQGAIPVGRVMVKAPDGTIGHIPQGQMQDALKAGYTQVQSNGN